MITIVVVVVFFFFCHYNWMLNEASVSQLHDIILLPTMITKSIETVSLIPLLPLTENID